MSISPETLEARVSSMFKGEPGSERLVTKRNLPILQSVLNIPEVASLPPDQQKAALIFCLYLERGLSWAALWSVDSGEVAEFTKGVNLCLGTAEVLGVELTQKIAGASIGSTLQFIKKRRE